MTEHILLTYVRVSPSDFSESDKLRRDRAIADIQEGSFAPVSFKSSRGAKSSALIDVKIGTEALDEFNFGTSAEIRSRDTKLLVVKDDSLFSPYVCI